jgi:molybdopterin converting factor small subunit
MIIIRLPSTLKVTSSDTLEVREPIASVAELIEVLDRRIPGFRDQLDDAVFNFAVNDEMLLHHARERELRDGDVVEIVPTISGGCSFPLDVLRRHQRTDAGCRRG